MPTVDIGTLRARIALDARGYVDAIGRSQQETAEMQAVVRRLQPEMQRLERAIADGEDESGDYARRLAEVKTELRDVRSRMAGSREETRRLTAEMRRAGRRAEDTGQQFRRSAAGVSFFSRAASTALGAVAAQLGTQALLGSLRSIDAQVTSTLERMVQLSGAAARVGVEPTELLAFQNALAQVGVDAETAAIGINELGVRISDFRVLGTGTFADLLAVIGEVNTEGRSLVDIAVEIVDRTSDLSAAQRAFALDAAFGGEAAERLNLRAATLEGTFAQLLETQRDQVSITNDQVQELANAGLEAANTANIIRDRLDVAIGRNTEAIQTWRAAWADARIGALDTIGSITRAFTEASFGDILREVLTLNTNLFEAARRDRARLTELPPADPTRGADTTVPRRAAEAQQTLADATNVANDAAERAAELTERRVALERRLDTAYARTRAAVEGANREVEAFGPVAEVASSFTERWSAALERSAEEQRRLAEETNKLRNSIADQFSDAILAGESFQDVLRNIGRELTRLALNTAIRNLLSRAGFGDRGRGGLLGLGGVFGFLQRGGPALAGRPYVVGEAGPELFVPRTSGTVVANGAGGFSPAITVNVSGSPDAAGLVATIRNEVVPIINGALAQAAADPVFRNAVRV